MPRPARPNPSTLSKSPEGRDRASRKSSHVRQETAQERRQRLREEAEARNALTPRERTRAHRRALQGQAAVRATLRAGETYAQVLKGMS